MDPRTQDQLWAGREHSCVGPRQSSLRCLSLRYWRARVAAPSIRWAHDSETDLGRSAPPIAFRDGHSTRRPYLHVERLSRTGSHDGSELKTGKIKWQERGFAKAQLLYADGKIILADEDGTLALCRASPEKFEVLSKASVLQNIAWTPPTLVGTRLYVRDRQTIAAFDLGR